MTSSEIMLVDDDRVSLTRLTALVTSLGWQPRIFCDGSEAWESFQESPVRIIMSDWEMPHVDGVELCHRVRADMASPYTYFILVTAAFTTDEDYTKAIEADVDDFLVKPLRRDAVWRRLHVAKRILNFTTHIQRLEQLLPICMYCKRIRDEGDQKQPPTWNAMEQYLHKRTGTNFSHGVCPDCVERVRREWGLKG